MLSIECTEQYTGARISGDYWDLDELLHACYEVIGDENRYYDYQGARNRILQVCYEIRNATKGNRNIEFVANGLHRGIMKTKNMIASEKNIYFSVEVLWPELIFMTLALNDFIDLHQQLIDPSPWNIHITTIRKFQSTVTNFLNEFLIEEHFLVFLQLMYDKSPKFFRYATQYVDVLNLEFIDLSIEERKEHLGAYAIRLLIEDEEYVALKQEILAAANVTKKKLHELPLEIKYPEFIEW